MALLPGAGAQSALPDTFGAPASREEQLDEAMEQARWRLGGLRLQPELGLRDVGTTESSTRDGEGLPERTVRDTRARAFAGLRGYLPVGPSVVTTAAVTPEYLWWNRNHERRRPVVAFGAGLFGFFNRLTVEAEARHDWVEDIPSPEIDELLQQRVDSALLAVELRATGRTSFFARASRSDVEVPEPDAAGIRGFVSRRESASALGVRRRISGSTALVASLEMREAEHDDPCGCDRSTRTMLVRMEHGSSRFDAHGELGWEESTRAPGRAGDQVDGWVGSFGILSRGRLAGGLYGERRTLTSLAEDIDGIEHARLGALVEAKVGWRVVPRFYVETGQDDYVSAVPDAGRHEQYRAYGARVGLTVGWASATAIELRHQSYDAPGEELDRSSTVLSWTFSVGVSPFARR